jgi:hypothetical protein
MTCSAIPKTLERGQGAEGVAQSEQNLPYPGVFCLTPYPYTF